jgi:serine protease
LSISPPLTETMKNKFIYLLLCILISQSCRKEPIVEKPGDVLLVKSLPAAQPAGNAYTRSELDRIIIDTLESANDFHWQQMDMKTLWSALQYNDHSLAIGYQPAFSHLIESDISKVDLSSGPYKDVHDALIGFILEELNRNGDTLIHWKDILVEDDPVLPVITIRTTDKSLLTRLYNLVNVRYLEPLDYFPEMARSGSGCSGSSEPLNATDYSVISPGSLLPWNYSHAGIPAAWNIAQGQGINIGVIDAGISSGQVLLGSMFNSGLSGVRAFNADYTFGSGAYTSCTHGTSMCGLAAGPRNTLYSTTGVAYRSGLYFIRACDDVVLNTSSEKLSVKNALIQIAGINSVRIISMSIGTPFASNVLKDGVDYAWAMNKIIFAAAGTSYTWTSWWGVIYPAAYSSCIAVTGVKENGNTCGTCHSGNDVMYTLVMERNTNSDRNTLSLPQSAYAPTYVGGSSCATAMAAGIGAVVWSARPSMTREQLLTCLTSTASLYPNRDALHGYGNLNASAALNYAVLNYPPVNYRELGN